MSILRLNKFPRVSAGYVRGYLDWHVLACLVVAQLIAFAPSGAQAADGELRWHINPGHGRPHPAGWRADATRPSGPLATWAMERGNGSGNRSPMLTIQRISDASVGVYNLFWTGQYLMRDGELEVRVRANSGRIDQGGGLIWRVQDANNYYVARYNPLENNFRLYYVKNGKRVMLASAERLEIPAGQWFHLRVSHRDRLIRGWFNGKRVWEVKDGELPNPGGVGVWSKADAASSFSGFRARRLNL